MPLRACRPCLRYWGCDEGDAALLCAHGARPEECPPCSGAAGWRALLQDVGAPPPHDRFPSSQHQQANDVYELHAAAQCHEVLCDPKLLRWHAHDADSSSNGFLSKTLRANVQAVPAAPWRSRRTSEEHRGGRCSTATARDGARRYCAELKSRTLCKNVCRHRSLADPLGCCTFQQRTGRKCDIFHPPEDILLLAQSKCRGGNAEENDVWKAVQGIYREMEARGVQSPVVLTPGAHRPRG